MIVRSEASSPEWPLVTIGLAVYNCADTLPLALESLRAQTFTDWELLVIDDGSTDDTLEVARRFTDSRVRVLTDGRRRRLAARLNECIELGRGDYFARMDGDDIAYPTRLERQVAYLRDNPEIDLVGASVAVFGGNGVVRGARRVPLSHAAICAHPLRSFPLPHPTFMGRMDWFREHRYDDRVPRAQEQDLLLRTYGLSRFANVPEILLGYREDDISIQKMLAAKRAHMKSLFRTHRKQRRIDRAILGVVQQGAITALTLVSVCTGLRYHLLRHRAAPVSDAELAEWDQIWRAINVATDRAAVPRAQEAYPRSLRGSV